jgi:hypothetical protein
MSLAVPEKVVVKESATPPDLRIYTHSSLLFWWPVWVVGLGMALWTYADGYSMVLVPRNATVGASQAQAPEGKALESPLVQVARSKVPGVVFVLTLLLVIFCTHAWIRGPWALFFAAACAALVLFVSWGDWWEPLLRRFRMLRVYINLGGYLLIAVPLLLAWLVTVFVFDRRTYMVFSVGQVRLGARLGEGERAYDTSHVAFEKRPYDWFRRLIGFGAGDMVVRIGGPHPEVVELCNVVHVGKRLRVMEDRLRTKDVV